MVTLERILKADDVRLEKLIELYEFSFPEEERREVNQLKRMINEVEAMHFCCILHDNVLAGLVVFWDMTDFYYMEHLAVFPEMRNHKIGQQVIAWWKENLHKPQLLEVEPAGDEMTERRINFYRRNGMDILEKNYIQPDYREDKGSCPLWIMGTETHPDLPIYIERIKQIAYRESLKFLNN